jgi:hypothetical protein
MLCELNGGYSSASDFDEETYALLAANNVEKGDDLQQDEEHVGAEAAEHYESLMVQRYTKCTNGEGLNKISGTRWFQTKCVIKEHSCHVIIDGGSLQQLGKC